MTQNMFQNSFYEITKNWLPARNTISFMSIRKMCAGSKSIYENEEKGTVHKSRMKCYDIVCIGGEEKLLATMENNNGKI